MLKAILMDLDGVVYRGRSPVDGAPAFVDRWRKRDIRFAFITNRSGRTVTDIAKHLDAIGVPCEEDEILTSATVTARHVARETVYAIGGDGLFEALRKKGVTITDQRPTYVVIGGDPEITYDKLVKVVRLVRGGARFVATNADRLVNTDSGVVPGNGAIVHAVAYATGVQPTVIGKPEPTIIEEATERLGVSKHEAILIGDNLETDVEAGRRAGIETVHLLTGISAGAHVTKRNYEELEDHLSRLRAKGGG